MNQKTGLFVGKFIGERKRIGERYIDCGFRRKKRIKVFGAVPKESVSDVRGDGWGESQEKGKPDEAMEKHRWNDNTRFSG